MFAYYKILRIHLDLAPSPPSTPTFLRFVSPWCPLPLSYSTVDRAPSAALLVDSQHDAKCRTAIQCYSMRYSTVDMENIAILLLNS